MSTNSLCKPSSCFMQMIRSATPLFILLLTFYRAILTVCTSRVYLIFPSIHLNLLTYSLNSLPLPHSHSHSDLGVIMCDDLSWSSHHSLIVSKALRTLGLIRRTVGTSASVPVRKSLYLLLVHSQFSYCSQVWRPYLLKDIAILESVQQRATKWILNDYHLDYKSRLCSLQLLPLMMSLEVNDIVFFLVSLKLPSPAFDITRYVSFVSSMTRSSGVKLQHKYSHCNSSRHFYFTRLPRLWNKLSLSVNLLDCSIPLAKCCLHHFLWSYFVDHFCCDNVCNYHFCCPCGSCIISQI